MDDRNEYVKNYVKKLFWSSNSNSTLEKLYLANSYYLNRYQTKYDDLSDLLTAFVNNDLLEYLDKKILENLTRLIIIFLDIPDVENQV